MKITGFLDFNGTTIFDQLVVAKELDLTNILIRQINDNYIYNINDDEIREISIITKKERINILAIDPLIKQYDLYDLESYESAHNNYIKTIDVAKALKVKYIFYKMPIINDVIDEFKTIKEQLTPLVDYAKKNGVTLILSSKNVKSNAIVYLIKNFNSKTITPIFNPKDHLDNRESPTVAYRLLRRNIRFFKASDIDKKNNPVLLGYGRLKMISIFKKLNRDKFRGYVILDDSFTNFIKGEQTIDIPWYKKIFKSKENIIDTYLKDYTKIIHPNDSSKKVEVMDIYKNQIDVLKVVFNLPR